jgi:hypothetical protein
MLVPRQPTNSHVNLAGGMLPRRTAINDLKMKRDMLEGFGHNSAFGSVGGGG